MAPLAILTSGRVVRTVPPWKELQNAGCWLSQYFHSLDHPWGRLGPSLDGQSSSKLSDQDHSLWSEKHFYPMSLLFLWGFKMHDLTITSGFHSPVIVIMFPPFFEPDLFDTGKYSLYRCQHFHTRFLDA